MSLRWKKKKKKKVSWRRSKKVPSSVFRSVFRIIFRIVFRIVLVKPTNAYVCRLGLVSLPPALSPSLGRSRGALSRLPSFTPCLSVCERVSLADRFLSFYCWWDHLLLASHCRFQIPLFFFFPSCIFFSWSGAIVLVLVQRRRSKEKIIIKQFWSSLSLCISFFRSHKKAVMSVCLLPVCLSVWRFWSSLCSLSPPSRLSVFCRHLFCCGLSWFSYRCSALVWFCNKGFAASSFCFVSSLFLKEFYLTLDCCGSTVVFLLLLFPLAVRSSLFLSFFLSPCQSRLWFSLSLSLSLSLCCSQVAF